ncbi:UNVERIFIED_CONTAM: hypothetical protein Sradi_2184800 [Sesamum radiatum]|uniref:Reverse transcriptase domain-containing protein n=1 Tax=Sesamum radiatum TaxID=300843 RepID=A0AAW2T1Z4_SESRA
MIEEAKSFKKNNQQTLLHSLFFIINIREQLHKPRRNTPLQQFNAITAPSYSVCINEEAHGYFRGARGLRQRDPMSPYLFVLAMELLRGIVQQMISTDPSFRFHWKCAELGLFQLGFADDLLLFCAADDHSIGLFQRGLDLFASLSGLYVNPTKSQLILSKAAHTERMQLLTAPWFQEGILPVCYLGLPLISSRLSLAACRPLLQKIDDRIHGWEGTSLSFAARVQLIKSVLMAINTYWVMAFVLSKGVIEEIERTFVPFYGKAQRVLGILKSLGHVSVHQLRKGVLEFAICLH